MLNISGELFREERSQSSGGPFWRIAALVVCASLVTFGLTWFFIKTDKTHDSASQSARPPISPARPIIPEGASRQPVAAATTQTPLAAPGNTRVSQTAKPASPVVSSTVSSEEDNEQQSERRHTPKRPTASARTPQPVVQTSPPPPDILVSGIAWQDTRSARRAVVNGFLMQEGNSVLGARITEIHQDKVRFSKDGRVFDVNLIASGFTGTTK